jgi:hypothetical protein
MRRQKGSDEETGKRGRGDRKKGVRRQKGSDEETGKRG